MMNDSRSFSAMDNIDRQIYAFMPPLGFPATSEPPTRPLTAAQRTGFLPTKSSTDIKVITKTRFISATLCYFSYRKTFMDKLATY